VAKTNRSIVTKRSAPPTRAGALVTAPQQLSAFCWAAEPFQCDILEARNRYGVSASRHHLFDRLETLDGWQIKRLVTRYVVMSVAAWQFHAVEFDIAWSALLTAKLWTWMLTG
jgi:hypothetical protein